MYVCFCACVQSFLCVKLNQVSVKKKQSTKHSWANLFTKPHKALILSPPLSS